VNFVVYLRLIVVLGMAVLAIIACSGGKTGKQTFSIAESKAYEASLLRQNCAICHGPEAEGKTLPEGALIPNLRHGPYKYPSDDNIYDHIANGGGGMVSFRGQLSEREIRLMVAFVRDNLREHEVK